MTKEEYLKSPWWHEDFDLRTVDIDGEVIYRKTKPELSPDDDNILDSGYWIHKTKSGQFFGMSAVADFWQNSLQTKEEWEQILEGSQDAIRPIRGDVYLPDNVRANQNNH